MPGAVLVGLGFPCMASIIHCMPAGFMHIGGAPILFSSPGTHTHSFDPLTRIVMVPSAFNSATVACLVTCSGPESRALVIRGSSALSSMSCPLSPGVSSANHVQLARTVGLDRRARPLPYYVHDDQ